MSDPNPDLRKPWKQLTEEQKQRESDEHEAGHPARDDNRIPIDENDK